MTAVTKQSDKVTSNGVKTTKHLLEPLYRKKQINFLANPIFQWFPYSIFFISSKLLNPENSLHFIC